MRHRGRRGPVAAVVAAVVALAGCGGGKHETPASPGVTTSAAKPNATESNPPGDIPDNTAFVPYRPAAGRYEVKVPEGWGRTDVPGGASFTDKLNTVRIETVSAAAAPTVASARSGEVPRIQTAVKNFALLRVETAQRRGGPAVRILYQADSEPSPVTGKVVREAVERYEFFSGGREAVLTLSGPVGADNVDPWQAVSDSFRWLR